LPVVMSLVMIGAPWLPESILRVEGTP
jgi:hypothetical protein